MVDKQQAGDILEHILLELQIEFTEDIDYAMLKTLSEAQAYFGKDFTEPYWERYLKLGDYYSFK